MKKLKLIIVSITVCMVCGLVQTSWAQTANAIQKLALSLDVAGSWIMTTNTVIVCPSGAQNIFNTKDTLSGAATVNSQCMEFPLACTNGSDVQFVASLTRDIRSNDWRGYHSGNWKLECVYIFTNISWTTNHTKWYTNYWETYKTNGTVITTNHHQQTIYTNIPVEHIKYRTNHTKLASGTMEGTCGSGTHRLPLLDCELCSDCSHFEGSLKGNTPATLTLPLKKIKATYAGNFVIPGVTNHIPCETMTVPPFGPVLMTIDGVVIEACP